MQLLSVLFIVCAAPLLLAAPPRRPTNSPFNDAWSSNWDNSSPNNEDCPDPLPSSNSGRGSSFQGSHGWNNNQAARIRSSSNSDYPSNNDNSNWDNGNGGWDTPDNNNWDDNNGGWNPPPSNNNDNFNWDDSSNDDGWDNSLSVASVNPNRASSRGGGGPFGTRSSGRPPFSSLSRQTSNRQQQSNRSRIQGWFDEQQPDDCDEFGNPIDPGTSNTRSFNPRSRPSNNRGRPSSSGNNNNRNRGGRSSGFFQESNLSQRSAFDTRSVRRNLRF